jgi:carbon-monoxide dehydrogenase small subunit
MAKMHISTTINGEPTEYLCEPNDTMLDVLRNELNMTGSKEGCGSGDCGACSITLDDRLVCSCLMLAAEANGAKIETIEGMAEGRNSSNPPRCNAASAHRAC